MSYSSLTLLTLVKSGLPALKLLKELIGLLENIDPLLLFSEVGVVTSTSDTKSSVSLSLEIDILGPYLS